MFLKYDLRWVFVLKVTPNHNDIVPMNKEQFLSGLIKATPITLYFQSFFMYILRNSAYTHASEERERITARIIGFISCHLYKCI